METGRRISLHTFFFRKRKYGGVAASHIKNHDSL